MRKLIPIDELTKLITNQRAYLLALANTELSDYQTKVLHAIYNENVALVTLFGIQVPDLTAIAKEHNEIAWLENLYRSSPDEKGTAIIGNEEDISNTNTTQEINGSTRVDGA